MDIRIRPTDTELLNEIADSNDREPHQQAAAFVHDALETYRARQSRGESGTATPRTMGGARRGTRDKAA